MVRGNHRDMHDTTGRRTKAKQGSTHGTRIQKRKMRERPSGTDLAALDAQHVDALQPQRQAVGEDQPAAADSTTGRLEPKQMNQALLLLSQQLHSQLPRHGHVYQTQAAALSWPDAPAESKKWWLLSHARPAATKLLQ